MTAPEAPDATGGNEELLTPRRRRPVVPTGGKDAVAPPVLTKSTWIPLGGSPPLGKPGAALPIASRQDGAADGGAPALPIASRQQEGASLPIASRQAASGGPALPIASRQEGASAGGPALPIASRQEGAGPAALPIASRQESASAGPALPIASRQAASGGPALPISSRQDSAGASGPALPIASRQESTAPGLAAALPIASRQEGYPASGAPALPIASRQEGGAAGMGAALPIASRQEGGAAGMGAALPIASRQEGGAAGMGALLPIASRQEVEAPAAGIGALLPIVSRQEGNEAIGELADKPPPRTPAGKKVQLDIPGASDSYWKDGPDTPEMAAGGLAAAATRCVSGLAELPQQICFVTPTITTPFRKKGRTPGPLPLRDYAAANPSPKTEGAWGLSIPDSCVSAAPSELESPAPWTPASTVRPRRISLEMIGTPLSRQTRSRNSLCWNTQEATVQCWHRKLSETYEDYNVNSMIGEGRCGTVFVVQHRQSENYYACKHLRKIDHDAAALLREVETMKRLDHPNVVRLYEVNEDADSLYLLMELCRGGDLFTRIYESVTLPEATAQVFAKQMFDALAYCHARGVVHRDVKPENFLLDDDSEECMNLKLADFGIATSSRASSKTCPTPGTVDHSGILKGSVPYMAPELFMNRWEALRSEAAGQTRLLAAGDLWACGVVVYVMLSGSLPFGEDPSHICAGSPPDFSREVWQNISEDAVDTINKLLNPNVQERWSAQQALQHQWVSSSQETGLTELLGEFGDGWEVDAENMDSPAKTKGLADGMLQCLQRWGRMPKLRRVALAGLAKRLEASHPSQKLAQLLFRTFRGGQAELLCDQLTCSLEAALQASADVQVPGQETHKSPDGSLSSQSTRTPGSVTGLHLRNRMWGAVGAVSNMVQKISGSSDESKDMSPASLWREEAATDGALGPADLRRLASALDGSGSGAVDYTLFVASVVPPSVYSDECRVREVFDQFDFKRRGSFGPEELKMYLGKTKSKESRQFSDMIKEFDADGDGRLNLAEFHRMISGCEAGSAAARCMP